MKPFFHTILAAALITASCNKDLQLESDPDFEVSTDATTYKVGEEITFKISGYADVVSFYSGEPLNDYTFREGRKVSIAGESLTLSFSSAVSQGSQQDQLSLLASSDFDGNYNSWESIRGANWTDITDRFTFGTNATFVASSAQDLTELVEEGKPLYFAFKYLTRPQAENGLARSWMIQSFAVTSSATVNDAPVLVTDQANAGFRFVEEDSINTPARSSLTATRLTLLGNIYKDPNDPIYDPNNPIYDPENPIYDPESELYDPNAVRPEFVPYDHDSPYNDPLREHWAISAPIATGEVDLGPDWSVAIRGIRNDILTEYRYTYSKPGTYKVYFVASNTTIDERSEVVRELTLTIEP